MLSVFNLICLHVDYMGGPNQMCWGFLLALWFKKHESNGDSMKFKWPSLPVFCIHNILSHNVNTTLSVWNKVERNHNCSWCESEMAAMWIWPHWHKTKAAHAASAHHEASRLLCHPNTVKYTYLKKTWHVCCL